MNKIDSIELDLLLEAIRRQYGYDFTNYARASIKRRIKAFLIQTEYSRISDLIAPILDNAGFFNEFVFSLSVTVTEMFRDPMFYKSFRSLVVPKLHTYPYIKIWHAGCATGEEVYSMAILLYEEGLLDRCQIYATDMNLVSVKRAKEGVYDVGQIKAFTHNYTQSGGQNPFSDYYTTKYQSAKIKNFLKTNMTFAKHNLVADKSFGQMNVILCRNVFIYFNRDLQNQVLGLFEQSLVPNGFLCLGTKESLLLTDYNTKYKELQDHQKIYQHRPGNQETVL